MEKWLKFGITNFFTALRAAGIFCMIPVFKAYGGLATALLSVGCFITDFIDGKLARGLKSSTFFAKTRSAKSVSSLWLYWVLL